MYNSFSLNTVLIIDASNERKLVIKQSLETIHHPVDICFDRSGKLWMSVVAPDNEPSVYISEYIDEKVVNCAFIRQHLSFDWFKLTRFYVVQLCSILH